MLKSQDRRNQVAKSPPGGDPLGHHKHAFRILHEKEIKFCDVESPCLGFVKPASVVYIIH